jgi:hypothetical protein
MLSAFVKNRVALHESLFPNENIIDFMNLPFENRDELLPYCVWQKGKEVKLI